jgi:hypothetical protein
VTLVARSLQETGLLEMRRGFFRIKDRPRMEVASCECYQQVKDLYEDCTSDMLAPRAGL